LISELCFCFSAVLRKADGEISGERLTGKKNRKESFAQWKLLKIPNLLANLLILKYIANAFHEKT